MLVSYIKQSKANNIILQSIMLSFWLNNQKTVKCKVLPDQNLVHKILQRLNNKWQSNKKKYFKKCIKTMTIFWKREDMSKKHQDILPKIRQLLRVISERDQWKLEDQGINQAQVQPVSDHQNKKNLHFGSKSSFTLNV